jgi:hypothetical protein
MSSLENEQRESTEMADTPNADEVNILAHILLFIQQWGSWLLGAGGLGLGGLFFRRASTYRDGIAKNAAAAALQAAALDRHEADIRELKAAKEVHADKIASLPTRDHLDEALRAIDQRMQAGFNQISSQMTALMSQRRTTD